MSDETPMVIPPTLGPGDDDPRSAAVSTAASGQAPLGPGDDDPRSPAVGVPLPAVPPAQPGDSVGENPDEAYHFLAPQPPGPGDSVHGPRQLVRIPKPRPTSAQESD